MQHWRPIHVLATIFWVLFSYFSVLVLLDQVTLTLGKGLILLAFFVVAGMSSMLSFQKPKT